MDTHSTTSALDTSVFGDARSDRFDPLLMAEGEYYFRDYSCNHWRSPTIRVPGQLKLCSLSLYIVPRDVHEPITRLPFRCVDAIDALSGQVSALGEDLFAVSSSEAVDLAVGDRTAPY
ncbi:hypothetical protein H632_c2444p0, partial [Helicosporidium sp. ATCC 50920]